MSELDFYQKNTVRDVIGREPSWIVSSGITLIVIITTLIFSLTWFIQYPDSISASVTLQSIQANVEHKSKVSGHLNTIFVSDGQSVLINQPLMLVDNNINYEQLLIIEKSITQHSEFEKLFSKLVKTTPNIQLMELQPYYNSLVKVLNSWKRLRTGKILIHNESSTEELVKKYRVLIIELENKQQIINEQIEIAQNRLKKTKGLFNKKLTPENEYIQDKQSLLKQKLSLNDTRISIELYRLKLDELQQRFVESKLNYEDEIAKKEEEIVDKSILLLSKVKSWKKNHVIVAKISGNISFNQYWKKNSIVDKDTALLNIIPSSPSMGAWMRVSGKGVGKIKSGQLVQIELDNYPAVEFGTINAKVESINMIPSSDGYLVKLELPSKLISSYGKIFEGITYLKGNGKIITQPRRLLTRFTDKILYSADQALR
jgi:multidrug efflux pump subunit AcrA (membrane-fusion protein)